MDDSEPKAGVRLRGLLGESVVYGLGSVADKIIGFLLLPITTSLMTPADFGVLNIFGTTATMLFLFVALGLHQSIPFFHAQAPDAIARRCVFAVSLSLGAAASLVLAIIGLPLTPILGERLFGSGGIVLFVMLFPFVFLQFVRQIGFARLRLQKRPATFAIINSLSTLAIRGVALALLAFGWGVRGWVTGELVGFLVTLFLIWPRVLSDLRPTLDSKLISTMLPYGLALTPALFAHWVMVGADRYVMLAVLENPREAVGLYSVGERISTVIQMVNFAFVLGWQRFAFENLQYDDGRDRVSQGLTIYVLLAGFVTLGLSLLGNDLTNTVLPSAYNAGTAVIPALTLAGFLGGMAELIGVGLQQSQRTALLSILTSFVAALQLAILFVAIPRFGIMGAAYASLACQALKLAIVWFASQKALPIPWEYGRMMLLAGVFVAAFVLGEMLEIFLPAWATLGQMALVAAAPIVIFGCGFLSQSETDRIVSVWNRIRNRRTSTGDLLSDDSERTES